MSKKVTKKSSTRGDGALTALKEWAIGKCEYTVHNDNSVTVRLCKNPSFEDDYSDGYLYDIVIERLNLQKALSDARKIWTALPTSKFSLSEKSSKVPSTLLKWAENDRCMYTVYTDGTAMVEIKEENKYNDDGPEYENIYRIVVDRKNLRMALLDAKKIWTVLQGLAIKRIY